MFPRLSSLTLSVLCAQHSDNNQDQGVGQQKPPAVANTHRRYVFPRSGGVVTVRGSQKLFNLPEKSAPARGIFRQRTPIRGYTPPTLSKAAANVGRYRPRTTGSSSFTDSRCSRELQAGVEIPFARFPRWHRVDLAFRAQQTFGSYNIQLPGPRTERKRNRKGRDLQGSRGVGFPKPPPEARSASPRRSAAIA